MQKRLIFSALSAVIILAAAALFLFRKGGGGSPVEAYRAVPSDAVLYVEDLDYIRMSEDVLASSRWWIDLVQFAGLQKTDSIMRSAFGRITASDRLYDLLGDEGCHLSFHLVGKDQLLPLLILEYGDHFDENAMLSLVQELWGSECVQNERRYEGERILDLSAGPGFIPGTYSLCCMNGLCLFSPSYMLVEESIRTLHAGERNELPESLSRLRGTAGNYVDANVYVNYAQLPKLFYPFLDQDHYGRVSSLSSLASWSELDLGVKDDAITLNGMLVSEAEKKLLLNAFRDQDPVKMELHSSFPSGISSFLHLGISDAKAFMDAYHEQLSTDVRTAIVSEEGRIVKAYQLDPLADLQAIAANELAWFKLSIGEGGEPQEVMILETRSASETEEVVMNWIDAYLQDNPYDLSSMRELYHLDQETTYPIYRLPDHFYKGLPPGKLFNSWFAFYENHLLFGPSVEVLSRVIYLNTLHKTLVRDPNFQALSPYFSNRSNLSLFLSPYATLEQLRSILNAESRSDMDKMELFLRRIPGFLAQFSREGELFYHSISLNYMSQIREEALTEWESLMDTAIQIKPVLVKNHNTSAKEIFVQDAAGRVYLINSAGRILWKQALGSAIMGEIYQVDFYKNGRLQYLFNTRDKIHLLDRNGNYVERYPITLRSSATAPLAVFDYDKSRDYRLFIPTEDRRIYLYGLEGKIITGWRFEKTESQVRAKLQHFRIGDRDYILCSDQNRTYILDRRGSERVKMREQLAASPNNPWTLDMNLGSRPRWISTDTRGNVQAVYKDGSYETLWRRESSPGHFFRMEDLNQDGKPEFIFADGNDLEAYYQDGKKVFSYRLRGDIAYMPDIYKFSSSDIKIGVTDAGRNRIYLVNSDGSLYSGFPLEGSTRFSIGYFSGSGSRFNLLVGSSNSFLYNYSIE